MMKLNFSTIAGAINGRNRTGFDPMSRNANCHASATEKKPPEELRKSVGAA